MQTSDPAPVIDGISFCISTNGKRVLKTLRSVQSIFGTMGPCEVDFEIIVAGNPNVQLESEKLLRVHAEQLAETGQLAALRNLSANLARYDVIVFLDDDILFPPSWFNRLAQFSRHHSWKILGNRVLSPDGTRYWDRATVSPHQLVDYEHPDDDPCLYQSGSFWILRKQVFENEKWDERISYYQQKSGGVNEDVEYSARLVEKGYVLSFNKDNKVWHWDDRYTEWRTEKEGRRCMLKEEITAAFGNQEFPAISEEFEDLLGKLQLYGCGDN